MEAMVSALLSDIQSLPPTASVKVIKTLHDIRLRIFHPPRSYLKSLLRSVVASVIHGCALWTLTLILFIYLFII
jgi:hypothetical protein